MKLGIIGNTRSTAAKILIAAAAIGFTTVACSSVKTEHASATEAQRDTTSEKSVIGSETQITQITDTPSTVATAQIPADAPVTLLAVEQLRTYTDRCLPNSPLPAPDTLDCSELGLRIKRVLNTEDKILDALATLDRLSRADGADDISRDLKDGRLEGSLTAQAIAGGILETLPQQDPEDPDEKLKELLDESAAIQAGVIPPPQ